MAARRKIDQRAAAASVRAAASASGAAGSRGGTTLEARAERLAYALVAALCLLLPLLFDPRLGGQFRMPKLFFAELVGLGSLIALAAAGRLTRISGGRGAAARAVLPLVLVAAALAPLARHPAPVAAALPALAIAAGCLAGWSAGFEAERLRAALLWSLPSAGATGLLGLAQALGWFQPFGVATDGLAGAERLAVIGLAGNPGDLGASLLLPALVALAELRRRFRLGPLLAGVGCFLGLAASQTLSAMAALVLGSLCVWGAGAPARRVARLAIAILALALGVTALIAPARQRLFEKGADLVSGDWNAVLTGRLDGWRVALRLFGDHPLSGTGLGSYRAEYCDAKAALVERGAEFFGEHQFPVFANAHSEPLEVAAELGLLGLLALGWALWGLGRALVRAGKALLETERGLAWGGAGGLLLLALFGFPFHVALLAYPALVFLAWVFAAAGDERGSADSGSGGSGRRWAALLALLLAGALAARAVRASERLEARRLLRSVELRTELALSSGRFEPRLAAAHLQALEDAARLDPADVAIAIARGNQLLLLGSLDRAVDAYRAAQRLERRPETHLNLGRALLRAGCDGEARVELAWAIRLDPTLLRQVPLADPERALAGLIFASGAECGLDSWSVVCPGGERCGEPAGGP